MHLAILKIYLRRKKEMLKMKIYFISTNGTDFNSFFKNTFYNNGLINPFYSVKELLLKDGIDLHEVTDNMSDADGFLHFSLNSLDLALKYRKKRHFYWANEPEVVCANNKLSRYKYLLNIFDYIFSWDDAAVKMYDRISKIQYPNIININEDLFWRKERKKITNISANKKSINPWELYSKRADSIAYFEGKIPNNFEYYGHGWNKSKCYLGACNSKSEILSGFDFSLCFENMYNTDGYITEKIIDCLLTGCIPIYYGAPNISKYVPSNCYIDFEKINDNDKLFELVMEMDESKIKIYKDNIHNYITGNQIQQFSDNSFANILSYAFFNYKLQNKVYLRILISVISASICPSLDYRKTLLRRKIRLLKRR